MPTAFGKPYSPILYFHFSGQESTVTRLFGETLRSKDGAAHAHWGWLAGARTRGRTLRRTRRARLLLGCRTALRPAAASVFAAQHPHAGLGERGMSDRRATRTGLREVPGSGQPDRATHAAREAPAVLPPEIRRR